MVRFSLSLSAVMALVLGLAACAPSGVQPVAQYRPGDEGRSCAALKAEIAGNEAEMGRLIPIGKAAGGGLEGAIGSVLVHVRQLFTESADDEALVLATLKRRNQWIRQVAFEKPDCQLPAPRYTFARKRSEDERRDY